MAVRGALSRYYDEIRPRTGVLPADVPKHIADEFARAQPIYQLLWDHFTGKHWLKRDGQNRYL